jgi:hypothetical protein
MFTGRKQSAINHAGYVSLLIPSKTIHINGSSSSKPNLSLEFRYLIFGGASKSRPTRSITKGARCDDIRPPRGNAIFPIWRRRRTPLFGIPNPAGKHDYFRIDIGFRILCLWRQRRRSFRIRADGPGGGVREHAFEISLVAGVSFSTRSSRFLIYVQSRSIIDSTGF